MVKNEIYTDDYASRAIVKRIFLTKEDISCDKLMLLVQALNERQLSLKKPIANLAGARIRFEGYSFAGGFVLKGTLTQAESRHLSYLFKDPYQEATNVFEGIFKSDLSMDEKTLSLLKERVLDEQAELKRDAYSYSMSRMEIVYSKPIVNSNLIQSMTLDDLNNAFEKVKSSRCGQILFVGRKPKKDALGNVSSFEKDFSGLPLDYLISSHGCFDSSFLSDTMNFIVEFTKITTLDEYLLLRAAFYAFSFKARKDIFEKYHVKCDVRFDCISNYRAVFSLICPRGKQAMISPILDSFLSDVWIRKSLDYYEEAIEEIRMENISMAGNFRLALNRMIRVFDFQLSGNVSFEQPVTFTREEFVKKATDIRKASFFKCVYDKGELIHD